jgi:branched-chain amino acid transport system permease protein
MRSTVSLIAVLAVAVAAPFVFYPVLLMLILCFALFACSFNLLLGFSGLLSFGHAMFFGSASYITAYVVKSWNWPSELGVLAGTLAAAVMGLIVGLVAIRRQGIYFAMITLAFSQLIYFYCLQARFTGGEDGIQAVPRRPLFGVIDIESDRTLYFVVLAVFCAGFVLIHRTIHSPFGEVLTAIRENEPRAISLGYDVNVYKLVAFVISASLAGLAGSTKSLVIQLATLTDVHWSMSGDVVLMTLVGGIGTIFGPMLGAAIIVAMQNILARTGEWVLVIQGIIFVLIVLSFRKGIVGEAQEWIQTRKKDRLREGKR